MIELKGVGQSLRQITVKNIGHDLPTLLVTNDLATSAREQPMALLRQARRET